MTNEGVHLTTAPSKVNNKHQVVNHTSNTRYTPSIEHVQYFDTKRNTFPSQHICCKVLISLFCISKINARYKQQSPNGGDTMIKQL